MSRKLLDFSVPHVLRNDTEYEAAVAEIDRLLDRAPKRGTREYELLEFLSVLVEAYEAREEPFDEALTAQELVDFMLEQKGWTRSDLADFMGGKSRVSEFFAGKRQLSKTQIDVLHKELGIPPEYLLGG
jgi:HTH-type transcriptional regulator/antitoxin HigA